MNININAKEMGSYDVIVCGGGTAGFIAAVSAARNGAKTLMIERESIPGGMITIGNAGITKSVVHTHNAKLYKENVLDKLATNPKDVQVVGGITKEFIDRLLKTNAGIGTSGQAGSYVFTSLFPAVWTVMDMLDEAGVDVLYMTNICGAICENNKVEGVVVYNKSGFGIYRANVFVDATGDADLVAFSGDDYVTGACESDLEEFEKCTPGAMMGFGTMFRMDNVDLGRLIEYLQQNPNKFHLHEFGVMDIDNVKESYENGEMVVFRFRFGERNELMQVYNTPIKNQVILLTGIHGRRTDGLDSEHVSKCIHELHGIVRSKLEMIKEVPGFENMVVNNVPELGVRETRHLVGEYRLKLKDVLTDTYFEDSIGRGGHPIDISGVKESLNVNDVRDDWSFSIPYRCLVPKTIDGLLVAGRCISASRAASGSTRPTVQCMITGEAAGTAAALCSKKEIQPRNIKTNELKTVLQEQGVVL